MVKMTKERAGQLLAPIANEPDFESNVAHLISDVAVAMELIADG